MVTCTQAGSSGGGGMVGEVRPLPRQVVMVQHAPGVPGTPPATTAGGRWVEGQGAQVLDDHQVGAGQRVVGPRVRRWFAA